MQACPVALRWGREVRWVGKCFLDPTNRFWNGYVGLLSGFFDFFAPNAALPHARILPNKCLAMTSPDCPEAANTAEPHPPCTFKRDCITTRAGFPLHAGPSHRPSSRKTENQEIWKFGIFKFLD